MGQYKIAWLPGDGVGNDVMEAARIVLDALKLDAEYLPGDVGWEFWKHEGDPLPERTIKLLQATDACLFGAITSKPKEEAGKELDSSLRRKKLVYSSPIVRLRQEFNLHTNLRPCKAYPGNPLNYHDFIDLVVFRENTEDLYSGIEFYPLPEDLVDTVSKHTNKMARFSEQAPEDVAVTLRVITRKASHSICYQAFSYAQKHGYKSVTVVEKPNVLRETSGMFLEEARKVAKEFPDVDLWDTNIDAMCMWLLKNPLDYGVLVSSNMFGDIISDLCAQLVGGLGFAASANIGDDYAVFEPTHGSAPKYAGQYKVNPMAMLLSCKLMPDWLGEDRLARTLENAVAAVILDNRVTTYDVGGSAGTLAVAEEVARSL
jgi:3-isopropylmalate dehydrogenase